MKQENPHNKVTPNPPISLNRPVGLAALTAQSQKSARFASHGTNLRRANAETLATQFATFQRQLHEFSIKHGADIRQNAQFRGEFAQMCAALGVDPLAAAVEGAKAKAKAKAAVELRAGGEKTEKSERGKEKGIAGLKGLFWERVGRKGDSRTPDKKDDDDDKYNSNTSLYDPNYDHDHDHGHSQVPQDGEDQGLSAETKHHLAEMLGGSINQFYWELGLRIVQIVIETRTENGGLIELAELKRRVRRPIRTGTGLGKGGGSDNGATAGNSSESESGSISGFGSGLDVSEQDIIHAIHSLAPLGPGYTIITIRRTRFLRSVAREFNPDQTTVLAAMQVLGYATVSMLRANLEWSTARAYAVLQDLVVDSVAWVDREEGVFWEAGSAEDVDGYVGGAWEDRYWAASWMYKRRDENNNNNQKRGGGDDDGNGDINDYDEILKDEDSHIQEEVLEHVPEVFASDLVETKTEAEGEEKVKAKDYKSMPSRNTPDSGEIDASTVTTTTAASAASTSSETNMNMNKRTKSILPIENDNNDTTNTNTADPPKTTITTEKRINDYDDDNDSDSDEGYDDEDEDDSTFEESQNRIRMELKALLEARIAEATSTSTST